MEILNLLLSNIWSLIFLLIIGFVLLVKGADWLVDGAAGIAKRMKVSDLIIGLTVVAFGTSMPEFVVNMLSAGEGNSELAITNVLGSNSINIFVILGLTAVIWPVTSTKEVRKVDIPYAFIGALLTLFFACYTLPKICSFQAILDGFSLHTSQNDYIVGFEGAILFVVFLIYMVVLTLRAKNTPEKGDTISPMSLGKAVVLLLVGLAGLTIGGELIVKSATAIAQKMHVSDAIIGLTIVALGTSLPELATSVMAAYKHNSDLALGNCIGSCTFNIFFVMAISAMVHPLQGYPGLWLDALMAFAGPALVWLFLLLNKKKEVNRLGGVVLLLIYAAYLTYRICSSC